MIMQVASNTHTYTHCQKPITVGCIRDNENDEIVFFFRTIFRENHLKQ